MELRDYLTVVRRRSLLVVAVMAVVVASALALTFRQEPVYSSKGRLAVAQGKSIFATTDSPADPDFAQTQIQYLQSEAVQSQVRAKLGSAPTVEAVQVGTTSIIEVSSHARTAATAAATTDAYMDAYLTYRRQQAADAVANATRPVQATLDSLQKEIDSLTAQVKTVSCPSTGECPERTAIEHDRDARVGGQVPLRQKLAELNIDASSADVGSVVVRASVPTSPTSPKPVFNGVLGLLLGSFLGVALAILFDSMDDSVRDSEDVERATGSGGVVAVIPRAAGARRKGEPQVVTLSEPASPAAEAYRSLRTSVRFLGVDRPLQSIQVTSASGQEGKTTTVANFGVVLARASELVIMVDCDLRRPRLHEHFGLTNDIGLTTVLLAETTLAESLQRVTPDGRLWLLAAGPRPPNPSDLLSSTRAGQVLSAVQEQATSVVIDCPPVLNFSDAAIMSAKVDGTLLVVRAGVSSRKKVARAVDILEQVGAPLLGTVLHAASTKNNEDAWGDGGSRRTKPANEAEAAGRAAPAYASDGWFSRSRQEREAEGGGDALIPSN